MEMWANIAAGEIKEEGVKPATTPKSFGFLRAK